MLFQNLDAKCQWHPSPRVSLLAKNWASSQNLEVLRKMGKHTRITSKCAIPMDSSDYIPITKRPPITAQVVIGTPGTIKKWMSAVVSCVKILVFDEADHMLAEKGRKKELMVKLHSEQFPVIMSKIENHFGTKVAEIANWRNGEAALRSAGLLSTNLLSKLS
ncbi:DEAD/DEAH box helicase domain - like 1, partial [Theobroma cacao]